MATRALVRIALLAFTAVIGAPAAYPQTQVARFASVAGSVEVQHAGKGDWVAVAVGNPASVGDAVRVGPNAFAKLLFVDEALVDLGPSTEMSIERYASGKAPRRSLLHLNQGALEVLVGGYGGESARYEVETPTAVVRVQGTQFIVRCDSADKATDVVGVDGSVAVQGTTGIIGPAVTVGPNEMTHVPRDGFPSPVKTLDAAEMKVFVQGLRLIGTGARDGLDTDNPIVEGRIVSPDDRPEVAAGGAPVQARAYLSPDIPGQTLLYSLSPDMRANTQPLPEYRLVPPNQSPNPPH
jgi:hypothetical protein